MSTNATRHLLSRKTYNGTVLKSEVDVYPKMLQCNDADPMKVNAGRRRYAYH